MLMGPLPLWIIFGSLPEAFFLLLYGRGRRILWCILSVSSNNLLRCSFYCTFSILLVLTLGCCLAGEATFSTAVLPTPSDLLLVLCFGCCLESAATFSTAVSNTASALLLVVATWQEQQPSQVQHLLRLQVAPPLQCQLHLQHYYYYYSS